MYIVVKAGGALGQGLKHGTLDGTHEFVAVGNASSLGGELALRAAEEFLQRLRKNQGEMKWTEAALAYASGAGALNIPVDTLRGPLERSEAPFPIVVNDAGLVTELAESCGNRVDISISPDEAVLFVRNVLTKLHEKGLLP